MKMYLNSLTFHKYKNRNIEALNNFNQPITIETGIFNSKIILVQ